MAGGLANHIELAFKSIWNHDVSAAADKELANDGLASSNSRRHGHLRIDRNVAPAQDNLAFGPHRALELLFTGQTGSDFFR